MSLTPAQFSQYIDPFMDYRQTIYEISPETARSNRTDLRLFTDFVKKHNYKSISAPAVIAFQYYLKKERKNSGPSINRKIFALKSYAKYLTYQQLTNADILPFKNVAKIRGGYKNPPHALSKTQIKTFFNAIDRTSFIGIRDYAVYALMYNLGLRVGEVHNLNLENLDMKHKKIKVLGKGRRERTLHLNAEMTQILSEWLSVRNHFLNSDKTKPVFISKKGNRLAIRTMEDNFTKIVKKANLISCFKVTCHTLRHSFASHLNDAGIDVLVIQSLLGHSSIRSVDIYIHPSEQRVRDALERLPGVRFMNQLIASGALKLRFQTRYRPRLE